jgi:hypothetical protein
VSLSKSSVAGAMKEFARASSNTSVHGSSTFNNCSHKPSANQNYAYMAGFFDQL